MIRIGISPFNFLQWDFWIATTLRIRTSPFDRFLPVQLPCQSGDKTRIVPAGLLCRREKLESTELPDGRMAYPAYPQLLNKLNYLIIIIIYLSCV